MVVSTCAGHYILFPNFPPSAQMKAQGSYLSDLNSDVANKKNRKQGNKNEGNAVRKRTWKHKSHVALNTDAIGNKKASILPI